MDPRVAGSASERTSIVVECRVEPSLLVGKIAEVGVHGSRIRIKRQRLLERCLRFAWLPRLPQSETEFAPGLRRSGTLAGFA